MKKQQKKLRKGSWKNEMGAEIILTICKWGVTALLAGAVSFVTTKLKLKKQLKTSEADALKERLKKIDEKNELLSNGLRSMLRQDIINTYDKYMKKGYAEVYVKDNIQDMYKNYHALGGNGTITHLVEEFMDLPASED